MLTKLESLCREADGRYATDRELQFLLNYTQSFPLRLRTYDKICSLESRIVQQVYSKLEERSPDVFIRGEQNLSSKWKQDTIRILRHTAVALLLNDPERFRDRVLLWFQTIMRAYNAQRSCDLTYQVMQEVMQSNLSPEEARLFCPLLEYTRKLLSGI